jgi:tetratricopeptide (TPR) repeat protein
MESEHGNIKDAVALAGRAIGLLKEEGTDVRNLARLRSAFGLLQLQLDPPNLTEARQLLTSGTEAMAWSSAGTIDRARNQLGLAQIDHLEGHREAALSACREVYETLGEAPSLAAKAKTIEGQVLATNGEVAAATAAYRTAAAHLTGLGADRAVAAQWFELAGLLRALGELELACDAYVSGAAAGGHAPVTRPVATPEVAGPVVDRVMEPELT